MNSLNLDLRAHFDRTLAVLLSKASSLRDLVNLLGNDTHHFFDGADLRGLDLGGEDLRGFTFSGTDLRDANLAGALFDEGALGSAIVDLLPIFDGDALMAIDTRGRVTLPAFLRKAMFRGQPEHLRVTIHRHETHPCLVAYGEGEYLRRMEADSIRHGHAEDRDRLRRAFGASETLQMDAAGRILLPPILREIARLGRDALFVGMGDRFEIWSPETVITDKRVSPELLQLAASRLAARGVNL